MKQWNPSFCAARALDYKCSRGSGIPRKPLCVLGAFCLAQVLGGSASPLATHAPVQVKPQRAQEQFLAGCLGIFGKGLSQLPARSQDASASCCFPVCNPSFETGSAPCFLASHNVPTCICPLLCSKQPSEVKRKGTVFSI